MSKSTLTGQKPSNSSSGPSPKDTRPVNRNTAVVVKK